MEYTSVDKFKVGQSINGFFLCSKKHLKTTRLGDLYLDLVLIDKTGIVRAKLWSNVEHFSSKFNEGNIVAIRGLIILFNEKNEINLKFINSVVDGFYDEYGYKSSLIVKTINESKEKLVKYIFAKIDSLSNPKSLLLKKIYKKNLDKIISIPLPLENHDVDGGFLLYTYRLLKVYEKISKEYTDLDYDKVIIYILLINLGYIDYYNLDSTFTLTDKGKKINHKSLGLNIFLNFYSKLKIINKEDEIFFNQCLTVTNFSKEPNINFVNALINLEGTYKKYIKSL